MVVKNWLDDPHHNCKPNANLKEYLKKEDSLVEENYDLLEEADFLNNCKLTMINTLTQHVKNIAKLTYTYREGKSESIYTTSVGQFMCFMKNLGF
jgi:hypothetical protein